MVYENGTEKKNLGIPVAIVLASIAVAFSYYMVQVNKQESIEKQQLLELELERDQWEVEQRQEESDAYRADLELKQEECESLADGVKDRWWNVMGVTYDSELYECVVTYTDTETGEVETSPLRLMQDN